jgi:hypothetical protein
MVRNTRASDHRSNTIFAFVFVALIIVLKVYSLELPPKIIPAVAQGGFFGPEEIELDSLLGDFILNRAEWLGILRAGRGFGICRSIDHVYSFTELKGIQLYSMSGTTVPDSLAKLDYEDVLFNLNDSSLCPLGGDITSFNELIKNHLPGIIDDGKALELIGFYLNTFDYYNRIFILHSLDDFIQLWTQDTSKADELLRKIDREKLKVPEKIADDIKVVQDFLTPLRTTTISGGYEIDLWTWEESMGTIEHWRFMVKRNHFSILDRRKVLEKRGPYFSFRSDLNDKIIENREE